MRLASRLAISTALLALAPAPLVAQPRSYAPDDPQPSLAVQAAPAGPTHRLSSPVSAIAPRTRRARAGCRARRFGNAATGILIGGMTGVAAGYVTGAVGAMWREDEEEAEAIRRTHRLNGALIGAGIGIMIGVTRPCVPEA